MKLLFQISLVVIGLVILAFFALYRSDLPAEQVEQAYVSPASEFMGVGDLRVHYRDEGSGPPLVLLHGTASSLHTWNGWTTALKDSFRVIRLDLPAFGLTGPRPDRNYQLMTYSQFLASFLDSLKIDHIHLAGNSFGGAVAWAFALDYPQRVDRLILIDPAGFRIQNDRSTFKLGRMPVIKHLVPHLTPRWLIRSSLRQAYGNPNLVTDTLIDRYYQLLRREGNRQALVDRLNAIRPPYEYDLAQLQQSTLLMWGTKDALIPVSHVDSFTRILPNVQTLIYPDIGHVPMEEIPLRTAQDARSFLSQSRDSSKK